MDGGDSPFGTQPADQLTESSGAFDDGAGNAFTSGWGQGGPLDLDALGAHIRAAFIAAKGPILKAWMGLAGVIFALYLVRMAFDLLGIHVLGILGWAGSIVGVMASLLGVLVAGALLSMYRPLRRRIYGDEASPPPGSDTPAEGPRQIIDEIKPVYVQVLFAYVILGALSGLGAFCLVLPGLAVAFFLSMAPYLAATRRLGVMEALQASFGLAKGHWQAMAVGLIGAFAILGVAIAFAGATAFVGGATAQALLRPLQWVISAACLFVLFVFWGGVFLTIDARDRGAALPAQLPVG